MKATPLFLGACAIASIAGAVGGATTNTTPIQNAGIGMDMLPERQVAFDRSDSGISDAALPDHYPMVTSNGKVEVAELSTRGLYSQQRFGWRSASYDPEPVPAYIDEPDPAFASVGENAPPVIEDAPMAAPVQPLRIEATSDGPRVIDVAAVLDGQG